VRVRMGFARLLPLPGLAVMVVAGVRAARYEPSWWDVGETCVNRIPCFTEAESASTLQNYYWVAWAGLLLVVLGIWLCAFALSSAPRSTPSVSGVAVHASVSGVVAGPTAAVGLALGFFAVFMGGALGVAVVAIAWLGLACALEALDQGPWPRTKCPRGIPALRGGRARRPGHADRDAGSPGAWAHEVCLRLGAVEPRGGRSHGTRGCSTGPSRPALGWMDGCRGHRPRRPGCSRGKPRAQPAEGMARRHVVFCGCLRDLAFAACTNHYPVHLHDAEPHADQRERATAVQPWRPDPRGRRVRSGDGALRLLTVSLPTTMTR
jgi:hypothetical protein